MLLKFSRLATVSVLALTAGCASLPPSPDERGVSVEQVVRAVQCELWAAREHSAATREKLSKYIATIDLELKIIDNNGLSLNGGKTYPESTGTLTVVAGGGLSAKSTRTTSLLFSVDLRKPIALPCLNVGTGLPYGASNLGIESWLRTVVSATSAQNASIVARPAETVYFVEFEVMLDGKLGVSFAAPSLLTLGLGVSASRKDTHTLTLSLSTPAPPPEPQEIRIVGWPKVIVDGAQIQASPRGASRPIAAPRGPSRSNSEVDAAIRRNELQIERRKLQNRTIILN